MQTYQPPTNRGYFGIGVEGISKPMNLGNLFRTAHAFGAAFGFTINAHYSLELGKSDTSGTPENIPFYNFKSMDQLVLADGCALIGVELADTAIDLPSFRHPRCAAYVFGPERGELSPNLMDQCSHIVRIPAKFCINVGTAGAIVMYDRIMTTRKFADRPVAWTGKITQHPKHIHGSPKRRNKN
jgi:tRNA G18 (ribose-2'-O)-methylase SpoU